jgi:hypothetical protein
MSTKLLDPPCKIEDVITMNFSIENLQKFLDFLALSDKVAYSQIEEISTKIIDIDNTKTQVTENTEKISILEHKTEDNTFTLNTSIENFKYQFSITDRKFEENYRVKKSFI